MLSVVPNLPLPTSPEEIDESARGAWEAGAGVVHVHIRDEHALPTAELVVTPLLTVNENVSRPRKLVLGV